MKIRQTFKSLILGHEQDENCEQSSGSHPVDGWSQKHALRTRGGQIEELCASIQVYGSNTADSLRQRSQRESDKCRLRLTYHIVVTPVIDHYAKCTWMVGFTVRPFQRTGRCPAWLAAAVTLRAVAKPAGHFCWQSNLCVTSHNPFSSVRFSGWFWPHIEINATPCFRCYR